MAKLTPRDHAKVAEWLRAKTTPVRLAMSEPRTMPDGSPNRALLRFEFLWTWSTERFGGHAATLQDRCWGRLGREAYMRRINRVRKACAVYGLILEPLPDPALGHVKLRTPEEISVYVNATPNPEERKRRKQEVYVEAYSSPVPLAGAVGNWWQRAPTDDSEGGIP